MTTPARPMTAIIGAGPFGLSIAAHLRNSGTQFRIFGKPMERWQRQMPIGMQLKSEWPASSLSDPDGRHTLQDFCARDGLACNNGPIPIETFTRYALSFQRSLVPSLEQVFVSTIEFKHDGFDLKLESGEEFHADNVIVATGLTNAAYRPRELAALPGHLSSHTGDHHDLSCFRGRDIVVIGGGQSALETAALLADEQANVTVVARQPAIQWNDTPKLRRKIWHRVRRPASPLGDGLGVWFCSTAPMLFRQLPLRARIAMVRRVLGPAGAWWLRDHFAERVALLNGHALHSVQEQGSRAVLHLIDPLGRQRTLSADHVIAGTGYRLRVQVLPFLGRELLRRLDCVDGLPTLSAGFESSVPGLYFAGLASAYDFGPVMRFIFGAHYAARRISAEIAAKAQQLPTRTLSGLGARPQPAAEQS
jgi:FAD-dependent urate hydroxylase